MRSILVQNWPRQNRAELPHKCDGFWFWAKKVLKGNQAIATNCGLFFQVAREVGLWVHLMGQKSFWKVPFALKWWTHFDVLCKRSNTNSSQGPILYFQQTRYMDNKMHDLPANPAEASDDDQACLCVAKSDNTMQPNCSTLLFREYLTGFRKRNEERRRIAREKEIEQLRGEKRRIKQEVSVEHSVGCFEWSRIDALTLTCPSPVSEERLSPEAAAVAWSRTGGHLVHLRPRRFVRFARAHHYCHECGRH